MRECQRLLGAAGFELNCLSDSPPARVEEPEPNQPKLRMAAEDDQEVGEEVH